MTWKCTFKKEGGKEDFGIATANYIEQIEGEDVIVFSYSRKIDSKENAIAFVQEAKNAKVKHDNDETKNNTIATTIQNLLNA